MYRIRTLESGCDRLVEANQDLRISVLAPVELFVSIGSFRDGDVVADNLARFHAPLNDQVAQIFVVALHGCLSPSNRHCHVEHFSDRKRVNTLLPLFVCCAGIGRHVDADKTDRASCIDHASAILDDLRRVFARSVFLVSRLVSNGIDSAIDSVEFVGT